MDDNAADFTEKAFPSEGNWTREQLKLAFNFYCQTPFGKLDARNKDVINLARLIGRSPSALAMKLVNLASLDPAILASGRAGLSNASKLDREIWDEFHSDWERLAVECENVRIHLSRLHQVVDSSLDEAIEPDFTGQTRQVVIQQRIKQNFFRRAVLSSYRSRCCISGVSEPKFLVASHIVPWRSDAKNRLNPKNGLCLSVIHDKAFDIGHFTLSKEFTIILSNSLRSTQDDFLKKVFCEIEGKKIEMPERFLPDTKFLEHHRNVLFVDSK